MPAEPIRDKNKLRQIAEYFFKRKQFRNYVLVILGVHTALRVSDLLQITWCDVYDESSKRFLTHITVKEKKTGKTKTIALNPQAVRALKMLYPHRRNQYVFANNRKKPAPISRVQAWRIIRQGVEGAGLCGRRISPHALRKTLGYHAWQDGTSPVVIMDIYNHSNYATTRRYLGVNQDDQDEIYMGLALF